MVLKDKQVWLVMVVATIAIFSSNRTADPALTIRHWTWSVWTLTLLIWLVCEKKCDYRIFRLRIFLAMAAFLILTALSGYIAINSGQWIYAVCKAIVFPAFLLVCVFIITDHQKFSIGMALLAMILCLVGLVQLAAGRPMIGTMVGVNIYPQTMFMLLPFCFMMPPNWLWAKIMSVVLILSVIVLSGTRSAIAAVIVFALVITATTTKRAGKALVILAAVVLVTGAMLFDARLFDGHSLNVRVSQWSDSIKMPAAGAGNWAIQYPAYQTGVWQTASKSRQFLTRAHNDFVEVLGELGPGGLVLYLTMFWAAMYYAARCRLWFVVAGICGYMTIANFSFPRERAALQIILCIYFAIAVKWYWIKRAPSGEVKRCWVVSIIICGLLVLCSFDFYIRHRTERLVAMVKVCLKQDKYEVARQIVDANYHWMSTVNTKTTPVMWFRGLASEGAGDIDGAIEDYNRALIDNPNHVFVLNNLGRVLFMRGRFDDAQVYYKKALEFKPEFGLVRDNLEICESWIEAKDANQKTDM